MTKQKKRSEVRRRREGSVPKTGTRAAQSYFVVFSEVNRFFNWLLHLAGSAEHFRKTAADVLIDTAKSDDERRDLEERARARGPIDELKRQRQILLEIVLVRHIEAFLNYLADLLFEVFTNRPETLRSSDRIEVARVLQHTSIEDLVHELARRRVESLSYSSFDDLCGFFDERFGLQIADPRAIDSIREAIEVRNISVHNRCVINERYVSRIKGDPSEVGKRKTLGINYLDRVVPALLSSVSELDKAARKKLKLKGVRFGKTEGLLSREPPQKNGP